MPTNSLITRVPALTSRNFICLEQSVHHNGREDRIWSFDCGPVETGYSACSQSGYVNQYDEPISYLCPGNGVVAGVASVHSNTAEDRRFDFKCCYLEGVFWTDCYVTSFLHDFDRPLDYSVDPGYYIVGGFSIHSNRQE
ncbi:unnamed protein product [Darwinula stevensoni]|uniref:Uncharacterized protein n=1 Tax=Darwinula stevensoni TaxID=69355 RepID=A0A7R9FQL3_9CRUS|nr:unnamed protein product [Darwinula stevensoni]CAG0899962.1 unnamed protein product [Darwinula stevensoni]